MIIAIAGVLAAAATARADSGNLGTDGAFVRAAGKVVMSASERAEILREWKRNPFESFGFDKRTSAFDGQEWYSLASAGPNGDFHYTVTVSQWMGQRTCFAIIIIYGKGAQESFDTVPFFPPDPRRNGFYSEKEVVAVLRKYSSGGRFDLQKYLLAHEPTRLMIEQTQEKWRKSEKILAELPGHLATMQFAAFDDGYSRDHFSFQNGPTKIEILKTGYHIVRIYDLNSEEVGPFAEYSSASDFIARTNDLRDLPAAPSAK